MEKIELGKVVRLHGYLGQMKVATKYDKDFNIKDIKKIIDENDNEFNVVKIFQTKDGVVVALDGVDLEKSKTYIGKMLYINREVVGDKILIEDLKGSEVYLEDERLIGKITDVEDYGTAEVFFVKTEKNKEIMFPNVKGLIKEFDHNNKKLIVIKSKLDEVCDYEDWYLNFISWNVYTT